MADIYYVTGVFKNNEPINVRFEFESSAEMMVEILEDSDYVEDVKCEQIH